MTTLPSLAAFLDEFFRIERYPQETNGIIHATERPVKRLGLAIEPGAELATWIERERLDAVLLHRAAKLETGTLPPELGVLGYHLPLDEALTLGWNLRLADVLGLTGPEVIGWKQGRPLGMIGAVSPRSVADYYQLVFDAFGGREESRTCERNEIGRVAVVGAMTEALVHEASERGADLYVTGQLRQPGRVAMLETGLGVIAVGQRRGEMWGLRALAHLLRERFSEMEVRTLGERVGSAMTTG